ncbi:MAG: hypothetical protein B6I35_11460 [Anaerolineaceae bacterium 4572_32.2]|nr:MAG: hypothetical protein B6I35_11460 [Anaerolineaceae bacterium 4572_32.2]
MPVSVPGALLATQFRHCAVAVVSLIVLAWAVVGCVPRQGDAGSAPATDGIYCLPVVARLAGGSNYAWFDVDCPAQPCPQSGQNCREPYGVIASYHTHADLIRQQLEAMYAGGQRRLRIPIYHMHGHNTGTVMDSQGGDLSPQHRQNLQQLLDDIREVGFEEIIVGFFPIGAYNTAFEWQVWNEQAYQENWQLIVNLRPIIAEAGVPYLIDLMNEGAPLAHQVMLCEYVRRLWRDYNAAFGKEDTLGFSIIGSDVVRYTTLVDILDETGYGRPQVYAVHLYEHFASDFERLDETMRASGDERPWIIGEVFYNDAEVAQSLADLSTTRVVQYVLQWPVTANRGCDGHCDVAPPVAFGQWLQCGQ